MGRGLDPDNVWKESVELNVGLHDHSVDVRIQKACTSVARVARNEDHGFGGTSSEGQFGSKLNGSHAID